MDLPAGQRHQELGMAGTRLGAPQSPLIPGGGPDTGPVEHGIPEQQLFLLGELGEVIVKRHADSIRGTYSFGNLGDSEIIGSVFGAW